MTVPVELLILDWRDPLRIFSFGSWPNIFLFFYLFNYLWFLVNYVLCLFIYLFFYPTLTGQNPTAEPYKLLYIKINIFSRQTAEGNH